MKKSIIITALFTVVLSFYSAFSYSYTAFSLMTGDNTFAVNPFGFTDGNGLTGTELFLSYGMTDQSDIWFSYYQDNTGENNFSVMTRYDLGGSNIVALKADPSAASAQYHMITENSRYAFQANAAAQFNYDHTDKPAFYAVLAPVIKIGTTGLDIFCEVNPGYYMQDQDFANLWVRPEGFGLDVVPGIGVIFGDLIVSLSAPVYDVTNDPTPTIGSWAFFAITSK